MIPAPGNDRARHRSTGPHLSVLHTEASRGFGGQEMRILAESRWLLDHGHQAILLCQPDSRLHEEASREGIPLKPVALGGPGDLGAFLQVRRVMRACRVNLVHTHSSIDSWFGGLAARTFRLPLVRSRHVSIPIRRSLIYRLPDRIIASGEAVRQALVTAGIPTERVVSIPAGVDPQRFHPGVSGHRIRQEFGAWGPIVGIIANIRGSKGHDVLLEAVPRVLEHATDARFLIVGDGVGFRGVQEKVASSGLANHVVMTGFRTDIPEILAALDVVVLPSLRSEGLSQVVLQAMAMGRPIVASTVGSPEAVEHGVTGVLVRPGDAEGLAEAILTVLADPARSRQLGRHARDRVLRTYTMEHSMTQTLTQYGLAVAAHQRTAKRD